MVSNAPSPSGRVQVVDAMRGFAAVAVLLFHLFASPPQAKILKQVFPWWIRVPSEHGRNGVAVFFVISGFVIGLSTRHLGFGVRDGARFAVRRQIRLDPPYYVVVAGVVVASFAERLVGGLVYKHFTAAQVGINLVYLQGIAGSLPVLAVAWTLCIEVQFYLFYTLLRIGAGGLRRISKGRLAAESLVRSAVTVSCCASFLLPTMGIAAEGWMFGTWWCFALGLVVAWVFTGDLRAILGWGLVLLMTFGMSMRTGGVLAGATDRWGGEWFALGTALLLLGLIARASIKSGIPRTLTYLGRVSYSLYLVHLPVIDYVMGALYKLWGQDRTGAVVAYGIAACVSFVLAEVLHRTVEAPAMRLAARFRSQSEASVDGE